LFPPGRDPKFIALSGPSIRHLWSEAQLMKDFPDVIVVIPDVKGPPNHVCDPPGRPRLVRKTMLHSTLLQEGAQLLKLAGGQT